MNLAHLSRMMGPYGLFEHARFRDPRPEHGYCTDDNGRALVLTADVRSDESDAIFAGCLEYVGAAHTPRGFRNRLSQAGEWLDDLGSEDAHGRAVWGLGVAARAGRLPESLYVVFDAACRRPLRYPRAIAYSLLGAVAAKDDPRAGDAAQAAIEHLTPRLPVPGRGGWPWPEPRLTYANARLPQVMLLAGAATDDARLCDAGLHLLDWLVEIEWRDDHFSFTPVGGRGPGESGPAFDQQPIEAWAMADACLAAWELTQEAVWTERARAAVEWFTGRNDVGVNLYDPTTGAGFDGLEADGVNLNCGAESTMAALAADVVGRRLESSAVTG